MSEKQNTIRTIRKVNELVREENDPKRLIEGVCPILTETMNYPYVFIALLHDNTQSVRVTASSGVDDVAEVAARLSEETYPECMKKVLETGDTIVIRDPALECAGWNLSAGCGEGACCCRQLHYDGKTYGMMMASVPLSAPGHEEGLSLFNEIADSLAFGLYKIELEDGLRRERRAVKEASAPAEELRRSEERFEMFAELAPVGIVISDGDENTLYANPAFVEMFGYTIEDLPSVQEWWALAYPDQTTRARVREEWRNIVKEARTGHSQSHPVEYPVTCKDGSIRHIEFRVSCADNLNVVVFNDITERKRAEQRLAGNKAELQAIYDNAQVMLCMLDEERRVLYANPAFTSFTGVSEDDLRAGRACGVFGCINAHDDRRGCGFGPNCAHCDILPVLEDTLASGVGHNNVEAHLVLDRNGKRREMTFLASATLIRTAAGNNILLSLNDITELKAANEELKRRESQLRQIFEILPIGLWFADKDGTLLRGNPAGVRIWGGEPHVPISEYGVFKAWRLPSGEYVEPEDWALAKTIRDGETIVDEQLEIESFDGKRRTILNYTAPVLDGEGNVDGAIVINLDITDRYELESQLRQAQKMEAVGRLAGGVAHDFNNMLSVISGNAELVLEDCNEDDPHQAEIKEILNAAHRSADLTRQLLAFARKQTVAPRALDLNDTIKSMLKMLRRLIGEGIELLWKPAGKLDCAYVDPAQIDQLLANLVINARDAIAQHPGKITIETGNVELDDEYCVRHTGYVPGRYVMFAVSDDGPGMDAEIKAHVFEPFFTTKEQGQGTGLGLATVYGIVKQNNGFINIYSEPGLGTTLKVYLPVHTPKRTDKADTRPQKTAAGGDETVLLVEDEPAILSLGKMILGRLGYQVIVASTPSEALRLAGEHSGAIDLLVTDVVMPEMNGHALAEKLLALYPHIKLLFMSGYTANVIANQGMLVEGVHFIEKPFSVQSLGEAVRKVLDTN